MQAQLRLEKDVEVHMYLGTSYQGESLGPCNPTLLGSSPHKKLHTGRSRMDSRLINHMTTGLPHGSRSEQTSVLSSGKFPWCGYYAYFLKLPCLCDEGLIDGRTLARIAKEIGNM